MKLIDLFEQDENAVSPVIGVILMVAITVILAAVIGTFVLGLGNSLQQTSPNANFDFDYTAGNDATVEVAHTGGDTIDASKNTLKVVDEDGNTVEFTDSSVSAGDSITFNNVDSGEMIRVIWKAQTGGNSATLAESEAP